MTRSDERRPGEPGRTDGRYAGVATETGLLVYDTHDETAWIESDTALDRAEMA